MRSDRPARPPPAISRHAAHSVSPSREASDARRDTSAGPRAKCSARSSIRGPSRCTRRPSAWRQSDSRSAVVSARQCPAAPRASSRWPVPTMMEKPAKSCRRSSAASLPSGSSVSTSTAKRPSAASRPSTAMKSRRCAGSAARRAPKGPQAEAETPGQRRRNGATAAAPGADQRRAGTRDVDRFGQRPDKVVPPIGNRAMVALFESLLHLRHALVLAEEQAGDAFVEFEGRSGVGIGVAEPYEPEAPQRRVGTEFGCAPGRIRSGGLAAKRESARDWSGALIPAMDCAAQASSSTSRSNGASPKIRPGDRWLRALR